jgi:hypothetical protein
MLAAGADPAWVARQLGHSSPLVTLRIYAHWVPGSKRVSAEVMDKGGDTQITHKRERSKDFVWKGKTLSG